MSGRGSRDKRHRPEERLTIEASVAAGPRKSNEEYKRGLSDLCEDIAGYRALSCGVLFWICDGTSNGHELPAWRHQPGFNSRILAHDLGRDFARLAQRALLQRDYRKCDLTNLLFEGIVQKWRERLLVYLAEIKKYGKLEMLLANIPQMADGEYRMQWSSTFLGGIYDERTQTLSVTNIGDSGMVVVADRVQTVGPKEERGILFATLSPRASGLDVDVSLIPVEANWEHFKGVRGFIAASDGVAKDLRVFLSQAAEALITESPIDRIWAQMSLQTRLTYDDRAVIVGRRAAGARHALKGIR